MVFQKLNVKALAMVCALLLICAGIFMIFKEIKDQGQIDLKAPFLTGKVESGFVGISLIVVSMFVIVATLHYRASEIRSFPKNQTFTVGDGRIQLRWQGYALGPVDYRYAQQLVVALSDKREVSPPINDDNGEPDEKDSVS